MYDARPLLPRLCLALSGVFLVTSLYALSASRRTPQSAATPSAPPAAQSVRIPQFDNEDVRVWRTTVLPHAPLTMHRHEHPRVIISLDGGTMKFVEQTGASETHVWETGHAYWLPANPPGTMHADVNAGDKPIQVMVVELLHEK
ncbi:MAG: hypothetical protein M3O02_10750 [Acidobacteriota bacterium]|nr:hypothetical protein [Acidobacteriota bacterium]